MNKKEIVILIAEDDDGHAELIQHGLISSGVSNEIIRFCDGEETWQYLNANILENQSDVKKDYLLLLDINMPRMNGIELLQKIKSQANLKEIPVIMLTTTDDPVEIKQCYRYGCSVYITKPIDFGKFAEILKRLGLFIQIIKV